MKGVTLKKICFSTEKYLLAQEKAIRKRLSKFKQRLYLEVGGKLLADFHATRTLPGYDPKSKLRLLQNLKDELELIYCVNAKHLENGKIRSDFNLPYGEFAVRALRNFQGLGLSKPKMVVNRFSGEKEATKFSQRVKALGYKVYFRGEIENYPDDLETVLSEKGFGADPYIEVKKPIIVVNGPGGNSGKLSTCLGQIYHEYKQGIKSGYAKLETFPIWNLPLNHPVNMAYEASTADIGDKNMIDPYHLEVYGKSAVNYNRDIESFPIIERIIGKISQNGNNPLLSYKSPTDMGINEIKKGIINDKLAQEAARQEILFYYFRYKEEFLNGMGEKKAMERTQELMRQLGLKEEDRKTVTPARGAAKEARTRKDKGSNGIFCGAALELPNGKIVTGKNSPLMHAESAALLNGLKELSGIPDSIDLIPGQIIKNITEFKKRVLNETSSNLDANEVLIALSLSKSINPLAKRALDAARKLRGCKMHTTHSLNEGDKKALRKLGIWYTTDAESAKEVIF